MKYKLVRNNNAESTAFGKWYAQPVCDKPMDLDGLAAHMAKHNTPFSKGTIKGFLTDMVTCVRELTLEGQQVKIDNLAIFSIGIKSKGVAMPGDFNARTDILAYRLRARATGEFTRKQLALEGTATETANNAVDTTQKSPKTEPTGNGD